MILRAVLLIPLFIAAVSAAQPAAADTHREMPDAPALAPGQFTTAVSLSMIHGNLVDSLDVDMYRIIVTDPAAFSAAVVGGTLFDSQLFLFSAGGPIGRSHRDDSELGEFLTASLGVIDPPPGLYYLAISEFNRDPVSMGGLIWASDPQSVERPPDGPGASNPLSGWTGFGGPGGDYWIQLTGCRAFTVNPQPGTWNEFADAGETTPGQATAGTGALTWIYGTLADTSDVDAYCIEITSPATFAATVFGQTVDFDSQLFLFNSSGDGVAQDDDNPAGGTANSALSGAFIPAAGTYMLVISGYDRDPLGAGSFPIWLDFPYGIERPPDGPGAPGPLAGWADTGILPLGFYGIALSGAVYCDAPTAVPRDAPRVLSMEAFPNPFNPTVHIKCVLPAPGRMRLAVYDAAGRRVRVLADEMMTASSVSLTWDGRDARGAPVASGVYFVKVESAHQARTQKITLLK
jgi:FlgD Ig-like domain